MGEKREEVVMLQIMPSTRVHGVNETSDEKCNLPSSIISTANSLCSTDSPPPSLWSFSPQGLVIGGKGKEGDTSTKMMSF